MSLQCDALTSVCWLHADLTFSPLTFDFWELTFNVPESGHLPCRFDLWLNKHRQIPLHKRSTIRSHQCHHSALFLAAPAFFDSERNWKPNWKVEFSTSTKSVRMNINVTAWACSAAARVFTCTQKYDWTHFIGSQFNIELPPKSFYS